jgi:L-aspartate oxidase
LAERRVDVLVVGAGLAGMAAALEAAGAGASVLVATGEPGSSELAQGGIAAALGESDSPRDHAADTVAAGAGLCDPQVVGALAEEAPGTVTWLAAQGVLFDRDSEGRPSLALEAAHSRPRIVHAGGDGSGAAVAGALRERLRELPGRVARVDGARLTALLLDGGGVAGGRLLGSGGELHVVAGATILATGGYAGLFERSTTTLGCDGSGLLAALGAGAVLADLEFVQFHPTAHAGPGPTFLLTEALRGAGAHLVDAGGRRFLADADPRGELAPRAVVTRAVVEHLRDSGQAHVFLDARHLGARRLRAEFPGFLERCRRAGLDPTAAPVPVAPSAHYTMGGIVTDAQGRTAVPRLLAAGECARTGVHGANRLASNSLLEAAVFGRRAARSAADSPPLAGPITLPSWGEGQGGGREGRLTLDEVRHVLTEGAGPLRDRHGLDHALRRLSPARGAGGRAETARQVALLVLLAALTREESRGAHVRTDHPDEVEAWSSREVVLRTALEVRDRAA